jgi:L-threonylcarbamoyladenylate synthase
VYGLGASARVPAAVARIYAVKQRPRDQALTIHVGGVADIDAWAARVPAWARHLAERTWPGPLTLVLPRARAVPGEITGGGETVGLRAPDHALARELLAALGRLEQAPPGIPAPSANPHGAMSTTRAADVWAALGDRIAYVLDGGPCAIGLESTVVDATGDRPRILRSGALAAEAIADATGLSVDLAATPASVDLPAVSAPIEPFDRPDALEAGAGDGVISRGPWPAGLPRPLHLCELGTDDADYARELYATIAALVARGCPRILVQRGSSSALGAAVSARLDRAALRR